MLFRRSPWLRLLAPALALTAWLGHAASIDAQNGPSGTPRAELIAAPQFRLPGEVDSNSPAVWDRVAGRNFLFVMTSISGRPYRSAGVAQSTLGVARNVALDPWPGGGVWMEAVVRDDGGTWYGYYHNEIPASMCGNDDRVVPRIGAARSTDRGLTWTDLGIVLEAPPRSYTCSSINIYNVGGVGDFSVQLDTDSRDLYFYFSAYLRSAMSQGVGVARLAWADRDAPAGKMTVWRNGAWLPATAVGRDNDRWIYPATSPIFPAAESWHDADTVVDAYWGPSIHWNTYLSQYVMLLNRAKDVEYGQEGIYVSFSPTIADPRGWSPPVKILNKGRWYPQVLGLDDGTGTDKTAGEWARFYMMGTSQHFIRFYR